MPEVRLRSRLLRGARVQSLGLKASVRAAREYVETLPLSSRQRAERRLALALEFQVLHTRANSGV
jgi:hypothetical protein